MNIYWHYNFSQNDHPFFVIQTTEGRKNLESTKWVLPRFFVANAPLNDNSYQQGYHSF